MTKAQIEGLAATLWQNLKLYENDPVIRKVIEGIMIDIANTISISSTIFNRDKFLERCGHSEWVKKK